MFWFRYPDKFVSTGMATIAYGIPALKYETVTRSISTNWWNRPNANSVIVVVTEGWWVIKTEARHTFTAEPYNQIY